MFYEKVFPFEKCDVRKDENNPVVVPDPDGANCVDKFSECGYSSRDADIMLDRGSAISRDGNTTSNEEIGVYNEANGKDVLNKDDLSIMKIVPQETLGRGFRFKQPSAKFKEYVMHTAYRLKDRSSKVLGYTLSHSPLCDM